jgi:Mrp family chromosome partitioning ATPase
MTEVNQIKQVVAVMSGKGGVGKSTLTALLAIALQKKGLRVGILDADITGPSIPKLFGLQQKPEASELGFFPVKSDTGLVIMSINLLLEKEDDPVIWRGPLIAGVIKQFWEEVVWGDLDFLLVDLPPGTGDAPLTVMQSLPLDGVVVVTSPQDLAGMVVRKAIKMAQKMNVPLLGVVENMSYLTCTHCGEKLYPFGKGKIQEFGLPLLGEIPLDPLLSEKGDQGQIEKVNSYQLLALDQFLEQLAEVKNGKTT